MPTNEVQATEVQEAYIPLVVLENAFRYWWIVAFLIVVGGLAGMLLHSQNSPLYEASAQFSVAIDYVSTGPLTQYDEDLAINTAGNIYISDEVLERVVNQASSEGIMIRIPELRKQIILERKFSVWNLRVRDPNPTVAKRLAMIWFSEGETIIQQSYQHAIQAYLLEGYIRSQEGCLRKVGVSEPVDGTCGSARFIDIQQNIQDAGLVLYRERQASRGLSASLRLGPFNPPEVSQDPVTLGRNQYVLLGSLLGLLCGVAMIELGVLKLFRKKS